MIDTYFDRVDAAFGYKPTRSRPISEDRRHFRGALYETYIDRLVAEARYNLDIAVARAANNHRHEIHHEIALGSTGSCYKSNGRMRQMWN